jgi:tRNA 2-thiocytidine biosynthesis protein TtcA
MIADKYCEKIARKVGQNIRKFKLIEPNDRVLITLSGGKDSLILLETLANRKKHIPFHFDLFAVHIHIPEIGYQVNHDFIKHHCDQHAIPLIIKEVEMSKDDGKQKKQTCFLCSWHRRKSIFDLTRELNCNKLAFGHHLDDAIETFFMNMIYHSSISSMPYKLRMFDGRVHLIRPLLNLFEQDMIDYAKHRNYPALIKNCPYEQETKRDAVRNIIKDLNALHPKSKINIFRSTSKIITEYLPEDPDGEDFL